MVPSLRFPETPPPSIPQQPVRPLASPPSPRTSPTHTTRRSSTKLPRPSVPTHPTFLVLRLRLLHHRRISPPPTVTVVSVVRRRARTSPVLFMPRRPLFLPLLPSLLPLPNNRLRRALLSDRLLPRNTPVTRTLLSPPFSTAPTHSVKPPPRTNSKVTR